MFPMGTGVPSSCTITVGLISRCTREIESFWLNGAQCPTCFHICRPSRGAPHNRTAAKFPGVTAVLLVLILH